MIASTDYEQVELYISCRGLKDLDFFGKSDPKVKLLGQTQGNWTQLGVTETLKDNLNPDFKKTIIVDFMFESKQPLKFEVWDVDDSGKDDLIGSVETTVGEIMGARKQILECDLKTKKAKTTGKLIVKAEKIGSTRNLVNWQWSAVKVMNTDGFFGSSDPFLRLFKQRFGGDWFQVHETEFIKDNLNPVWKPFSITDDKLCSGKHGQTFKIECWDNSKSGKYNFIGQIEISLEQLKGGQKEFPLANPKSSKAGTLKLLSFSIQEKPTFIDYLRGGEQLNLIAAIDFTGSNGIPTQPSSLHAFKPGGLNEYQTALSAVGNIVLNYDSDKLVPVYGFGGKPHFPTLNQNTVSHCFPCTGDFQKAQVQGLQGLLDVYAHALTNVELSGPTYFNPLITEALKVCELNKQNELDVYTVLLIITDGEIHDMEETINTIVKASELPLSIIIIGVGNEDFTKMEILDGDKGLKNSQGKSAARDFVQFVPFRKFQNDITLLAKHVLAEIPEQLVQYKTLVGRKPKVQVHN